MPRVAFNNKNNFPQYVPGNDSSSSSSNGESELQDPIHTTFERGPMVNTEVNQNEFSSQRLPSPW